MFVPDKPFQPNLMFAGKALPTNIRQGANTLAYYENSQIAAVKSFIGLAPVNNVIKLCTVLIYEIFVTS